MRSTLDGWFTEDFAAGRRIRWTRTHATASGEIDFGRTVVIGLVDLAEAIEHGQVVANYVVEGSDGGPWRELSRGTTIGYRKIDRFPGVPVGRLRLTIVQALDTPRPIRIRAFAGV
jgi:alpha-L-fucosidase